MFLKKQLFLQLILVFSALSYGTIAQAQKELKLAQIGKANFQKTNPQYRAFVVYKKDAKSVFRILPSELFGFVSDTLYFEIKRSSNAKMPLNIRCTNNKSIKFKTTYSHDTLVFHFSKKKSALHFYAFPEKTIYQSKFAQPIPNWEQDTSFGFIRIINQFIRYAPIPEAKNINIALFDFDKNGVFNEQDKVSLSNDSYFLFKETGNALFVKDIKRIKINDQVYTFSIKNNLLPSILLTPTSDTTFDISYSSTFPDFDINGQSLYSYFETYKYVLIALWSDECKLCNSAYNGLNKMPKNTAVIGMYEKENYVDSIGKALGQTYPTIPLNKAIVGQIGAAGLPTYALINSAHELVLVTKNLGEIIEIVGK